MDKVSLLLVQNLAVADLLYILSNILPSVVTYIAGRYVLGKIYCFISAQTSFIYGQVNILTVLAITAYRLHLLRHPLSTVSRCTGKIGLVVIWVIASSTTITCFAYKSDSVFSQKSAKCLSTIYINKDASLHIRVQTGIIIIVPLISIVIINILLFIISFKSSKKYKTSTERNSARALLTVCALSSVFIVSWIPYLIYLMWKGVNPDLPVAVEQTALSCIMVNSFCNPVLYTMTNRRFGNYVWSMIRSLTPGIGSDSITATDSSRKTTNSEI